MIHQPDNPYIYIRFYCLIDFHRAPYEGIDKKYFLHNQSCIGGCWHVHGNIEIRILIMVNP